MQGAYIPQYPPVPSSSVSVEVGASFLCGEAGTQGEADFCPEQALSLTALLILFLPGGCEECREEKASLMFTASLLSSVQTGMQLQLLKRSENEQWLTYFSE